MVTNLPHLVSNVKTTSNQCYILYVTLSRILIHTEEKPYGKSIHAGEEPYIYNFIIVNFIKKKQFTQITPCQTYWLKLTILFTENSWPKSYC